MSTSSSCSFLRPPYRLSPARIVLFVLLLSSSNLHGMVEDDRLAEWVGLFPPRTAALIGMRAPAAGTTSLFQQIRSEILFGGLFKDALQEGRPLVEEASESGGVLLGWLDAPHSGVGWVALLPGSGEQLDRLSESGSWERLPPRGSLEMAKPAAGASTGAGLLAVRMHDLMLVGQAAAVERLVERRQTHRLPPQCDTWLRRILGRSSAAPIWGLLGRRWFEIASAQTEAVPGRVFLRDQLNSIRQASFEAFVDEKISFHMDTIADNDAAARLMTDELAEFIHNAAPEGAPVELREAMQQAEIDRRGGVIQTRMRITPQVMLRIKDQQATQAILRWRLPAIRREEDKQVSTLLSHLALGPGGRVADIGAGNGFMTFRLARLVGPEGRVWAVEIQPELIDRLKARAERTSIHNLLPVLGKADDPGLAPTSLDAVLVVNAYHEMSEHEKILGHVYRALRPGGRLVVSEPYSPSSRSQERGSQTNRHQLAPELLQEDLVQAGFTILVREDDFVDVDQDRKESLLVAVKPLDSGRRPRD